MDKILYGMIKGLNLWSLLMLLYRVGGKDALKRFLTIPESALAKLPLSTKPERLAMMIEERDEMVEETMEFLESCTDADFIDPDEPTEN